MTAYTGTSLSKHGRPLLLISRHGHQRAYQVAAVHEGTRGISYSSSTTVCAVLIAELVVEIFFVPPGYEDTVRMGGSLASSAEGPEPGCGEDGLTDAEFRLVSARARDPHLNGQERAAAAITWNPS